MNQDIVCKIVKAAGVSAGELILVHFWGEDADKAIAHQFMEAVASAGAAPILLQQARTVNRAIFLASADGSFGEKYFAMLSGFDAVLDVFAYQPVILGCEIQEAKYALYRNYMAQLFSALMKCKRFTQIRVPTEANAQDSGLEASDYIVRMTRAYDVDYTALAAACKTKAGELGGAKQPVLHTGAGCKLHFDLTGREWCIDAGDGDLPCGEVYIAPLEEKTHGSVFFERLYIEECGMFEHVKLFVESGRLSGSDNASVQSFIGGLSAESKVVCELGLGMNPHVTELCGYTALDEKMLGTFHIAIGANTMFGGRNDASCHIDFVGFGKILF